jgi:DNA-binding NarL/FixJ family response regulator
VRFALLTAGSQERLWLQNLLAQTAYRRETFEWAVPAFAGQSARFEYPPDVLILTEAAAPPHLFTQLLNDLSDLTAVMLITADPASYRIFPTPAKSRVWGILKPPSHPIQVQAAIAALLQGLCVMPPAPEEQALAEPLTPRELEIGALLAQGLTNRQIAVHLYLSENTVKTHITAIYGKTGVNNRAEWVALAARMGWIAL